MNFNSAPVAFSPGGRFMLVQHNYGQGQGYGSSLAVLDFTGTVVHTTAVSAGVNTAPDSWAPSCTAVLLRQLVPAEHRGLLDLRIWHEPAKTRIWLWDLSASVPELINEPAVTWTAWATPPAGSLLVGCKTRQVTLAAGQDGGVCQRDLQLTDAQPRSPQMRSGSVVCGTRLTMLSGWQEGHGHMLLELYSVQGSQLVAERSISAAPGIFVNGQLRVSDDGELLAALACDVKTVNGLHQLAETRLVLVSLASGSVQEFPLLGALAVGLDHWSPSIHWSADCTAVLVSARCGRGHQLFSFV